MNIILELLRFFIQKSYKPFFLYSFMKNTYIVLIVLAVIIIGFVGWKLASPLFLDKEVNEEIIQPTSNEEIISQGSFVNADDFHKTSGTAKVVEQDGKKYLVLENFKTTNGPDLFVYLAKDKDATEFVNLGALKGNIGNQQYEIPDDINLNDYDNALIWCRAFKVLFGSAEMS